MTQPAGAAEPKGQPMGETVKHYINLRNVLKNFIYTLLLCTFIALFLTLTISQGSFVINWVMSLSFGICICLIILFLLWKLKPEKPLSFFLILITGLGAGIFLGFQIGPFVLQKAFSLTFSHHKKDLISSITLALTFGSVICYFFYSQARLRVGKAQIQQERIQRLSKEKEALEANLRLLQAQIEPHFLFNTLSNILSLIDTDPDRGKSMLMDLIQYLRTSLSRTRHDLITVGQEMEIIQAYLNIQKIRMNERLRFRIDLPETLRDHPFPPMLIQPLVENAVKHGLEPQIEGGAIRIKGEEANGLIRIEILDTGSGFHSYSETGVGLCNVRERLRLLYGGKGRLIIEENKPKGVKAILEVPRQEGA